MSLLFAPIFLRRTHVIYDTLTRLDPSFAGIYKTQVYDPKYVDSLNTG
ncbi:hypothetical protein LEP1GSC021_0245, partial [Leptospira noguchii str. 1993005606]